MKSDILLVSTADWDNPFWTNKQHVAVQLALRGHNVFYVESLGLRRPTVSKKDFSRILRRVSRIFAPPRQVEPNLWVWSPFILPFHDVRLVRAINRRLMQAMIGFWLSRLGMMPKILWTYSPITPELFALDGFEQVIYHAVDDIAAQPGMPKAAINAAEADLVSRADFVFVTALSLLEKHRKLNSNTHYFPNVADYEHFSKAQLPETSVPQDLIALPQPIIGLVGAISGYKIDFDLIIDVALKRPNWSLVLIGAVGEGDPWTDVSQISAIPNVHLLGPRPYQDLPSYIKGFDVAFLANRTNEYTASMFPMKFFEYLASGKPVVATALPALVEYDSVASFCNGSDEFIDGVERALAGEAAPLEARVSAAKANTYMERTERMMQLVEAGGKSGT